MQLKIEIPKGCGGVEHEPNPRLLEDHRGSFAHG